MGVAGRVTLDVTENAVGLALLCTITQIRMHYACKAAANVPFAATAVLGARTASYTHECTHGDPDSQQPQTARHLLADGPSPLLGLAGAATDWVACCPAAVVLLLLLLLLDMFLLALHTASC